MGCVRVPWGSGSMIFCGPKLSKPVACFSASERKHPATIQCDHEIAPGKTCDRNCCAKHSKHVGKDRDLCLEHWVQAGRPPVVA